MDNTEKFLTWLEGFTDASESAESKIIFDKAKSFLLGENTEKDSPTSPYVWHGTTTTLKGTFSCENKTENNG